MWCVKRLRVAVLMDGGVENVVADHGVQDQGVAVGQGEDGMA